MAYLKSVFTFWIIVALTLMSFTFVSAQPVPIPPKPKTDTESITMYHVYVEEGDAKAQYSLGLLYLDGGYVPIDEKRGLKLLRASAEQGYVEAEFMLGLTLRIANPPYVYKVIEGDIIEAIYWLSKATNKGHVLAESVLDGIY